MASLQTFVMCQRIITDTETGSVSYIDVLEQATVPKIPFMLPPVCLGAIWASDTEGETIEVRYQIKSPAGHVVQKYPPDIIKFTRKRHRHNVTIFGVIVTETGDYSFQYQIKSVDRWEAAATMCMPVVVRSPTPPSQESPADVDGQ